MNMMNTMNNEHGHIVQHTYICLTLCLLTSVPAFANTMQCDGWFKLPCALVFLVMFVLLHASDFLFASFSHTFIYVLFRSIHLLCVCVLALLFLFLLLLFSCRCVCVKFISVFQDRCCCCCFISVPLLHSLVLLFLPACLG